jgi:perosamine synthetase
MNYRYPVYQPSLAGNEKKYVADCLDSTWISSKGAYLGKFETAFAAYSEVKYATAVCNGTVALHLALLALGIGPGDEVIVPTFTYIASVNAIAYTGATPVFVDSLPDTWQMNPDDVRRKITANTRAIMAVHLYGHPCNLDALLKIAREHDIFLVEDCAESIGSKYKGRHVGSFGDIATFSFFGNKTITTGEGGMVTTNDETLFDRAVHFKGQGLAKHRQYWHDVVGYNYRMTNICAAIGLAQLEQADHFVQQKQRVAARYAAGLEGSGLDWHRAAPDVFHTYWMFTVLVENPADREPLREHLAAQGIETRPTFYPAHTMPMYASKYQKHHVAEQLGWRGINLPSYPGLTDADVDFIVQTTRSFRI